MNKLHKKDFSIAIKKGTGANKSKFAKEAVQGEMYFATDTGILYVANTTAGANDAVLTEYDTSTPYSQYSVSLDGTDDYITSSATLGSTSQTTCTYSAWIKTSNTSSAMSFFATTGAGSGSTTQELNLLRVTNGNFYIIIRNNTSSYTNNSIGSTTSGDTNICDDLWHHVALVVDGTSFKIYIDGGDAAINASNTSNSSGPAFSGTSTVSFVGSSNQVYLGKNGSYNSYEWDGKYDEVAFIRSALSDSDIRSIYGSGRPSDLSSYSPFQWLRMGDNDDGTGTTVTDQGSGGNNATLHQGATFSTDIP